MAAIAAAVVLDLDFGLVMAVVLGVVAAAP